MHRRLTGQITRLALVVAITILSGCGYIATTAIAVVTSRGGGSGTVVDGNDPSTAQLLSLRERGLQVQTVRVLVADAEADPAALVLEYDGGAAASPVSVPGAAGGAASAPMHPATLVAIRRVHGGVGDVVVPLAGAPQGRTPALETSAAGETYDLDWAWRQDLPGPARRSAAVRLSVVGSTTPPVLVEGVKIGNDAPVLENVAVEGREGRVVVKYDLSDSTGDACDVSAFVVAPGALAAALETAGPRPDVVGGRTSGLVASPSAERIDFTWDTTVKFAGRDVGVTVRLIATDDAGAASGAVETGAIALDNNRPPIALIGLPARSTSGLVSIPYLLLDAEGDAVDVEVRARLESAPTASAQPASAAQGTVVAALASSPGGTPQVFVWRASSDLHGTQAERVVVSVHPVDASGNAGVTQTSQVFVVGNDAPTVTAQVNPFASGEVLVTIGVFDSSADLASLEVEFQAPGQPFQPCTIASATGAADPLSDVSTTSTTRTGEPATHAVGWQSDLDLPDFAPALVTIRVRATDSLGARSGYALAETTLDNRGVDTPPSVQMLSLPRGDAQRQVVPVRIADAESGDARLLLEVRDDPSASTFTAATLVEVRPHAGGSALPLGGAAHGATPPLATSPAGVDYDLVWEWRTDLGGEARPSASLRLTVVSEPGVPPLVVTGQKIGNDPPALSGLSLEGTAGSVTVRYSLRDSTRDVCDVVAVARAGRFEATLTPADVVGALTAIVASGTAEARAFTWDTTALFGGRDVSVDLTLEARDDTGARSAAVTLAAIALDNNRPPSAVVSTPSRTASPLVTVSYLLRDPESDPVDVVVTRRLEGAPTASALPATPAGGTAVSGLGTSASGALNIFVWNVAQDIDVTHAARVILGVRPTDESGNPGPVAETAVFVVGNDAPTLTATVATFSTGDVQVDVALFDSSADLASLELEFSSGGAFARCTINVTGVADPLAALATTSPTSTAAPARHTFVWQSTADLPDIAPTSVTLRARATDDFGGRSGYASVTTTLDNRGVDTPPSVQMLSLPRGDAQRQVVPVRIADAESGDARLLLEVRDDPGASTFTAATLVEVRPRAGGPAIPLGGAPRGTTPPLGTSPGGVEYDLVWEWRTDLAGEARPSASLRLTVIGEPSVPPLVVTGQKIGNDPPALSGLSLEGAGGSVTVRYSLRDSTRDVCDVVAVARAGRFEATLTPADVVGALTGIVASGTAEARAFTWDTTALFGGRDVSVDLTLEARDDTGARSAAVTLAAIALDNNRPPSAEVTTPARSASPLVTVSYLLRDAESDPVDVVVTRRLEGTPTASALPATPAGGTAVSGLGTSASGALNIFVWSVGQDLGVTHAARVILGVRPTDESGNQGPLAETAAFVVGNDAPTLTATVAPSGAGDVQVDVALFDSSADLASLELEFSSGGAPFAPCAISRTGLADPLADLATTSPTSTAAPARHTFVWQSRGDLPDALDEAVALRVRATDVFGGRSGYALAATSLTNRAPQTPPSLLPDPAGSLAQRGLGPFIDVPFRLVDAQSNPADIVVEYTTPALRGAFVAATRAAGSTPTAALASSETGVDHSFRWDAAADLDGASEVTLRLTAIDLVGGGRATATARTVALNDPPLAEVAAAPAPGTALLGFLPVRVLLADSTGDPSAVEFTVVIRSAAGAILSTATATVPGSGTLVSTSPEGSLVEYVWNTLADLRGTAPADVRLRIRPRDSLGLAGGTLEIGPYTNANGDRPIVALSPVTRTSGPLTLAFALADAQTDTATVEVAYSLDGAAFLLASDANIRSAAGPATGTAARTGLSSAPVAGAPARVALLWDAPADLLANRGLSGAQPLTVRIRARDAVGFGVSVTAAAISGNDAPAILAVVPDTPALVVVPFSITLQDSSADPVTVTVDFSVGAGPFQPATIAAGQREGISTAPGAGVQHRLAWAAGRDLTDLGLTSQVVSDVRLRVRADDFALDATAPVSRTSAPFEVFLTDDPIALITSPAPGSVVVPVAGAVTVTYLLFDLPGDPTMIDVRFQAPGAASRTATRGDGGDGVAGLASSPGGTAHAFVWRVADDLPFDVEGVTFTMVTREQATDPGIAAVVRDLAIDGNAAPVVTLDDFAGAVTPFVDVGAVVRDAESDLVDLDFRVSFDGGAHFRDATVVPAPLALAAGPAGTRHRLSWLLAEDLIRAGLSAATQTSTVFEVTPSDGPGPLSRGPTFRTTIASFDAALVLGTPDPALSSIAVAPTRLAAQSAASVTVTVIDVRGQPAQGHTVSLSYGAASIVSGAGTTDAAGVYRGTVRSDLPVVAAVTAVIDPGPRQVVLTPVTITFDPLTPGSITDLRAAYAGFQNVNQLRLLWTATGADGQNGTAASYEMKVSTTGPITSETLFNAATTISQSFTPLVAGSLEDRTIGQTWNPTLGTPAGTRYFAVRAIDVEGNKGPISNSITVDMKVAATFPASSFDFGTVPVGTAFDHVFEISNTASYVDFTVATTAYSGSSTLTLVSGGNSTNAFIAAGQRRQIVVRFLPTDLAAFAGTVTITHPHTGAPSSIPSPQTFTLSGTGVPAAVNHPPTCTARVVAPALVTPGTAVTVSVDVRDLENALPATDTITSVAIDLRPVGGAAAASMTADVVLDGFTRRYARVVDTTGLAAGAYPLLVTATDAQGLTGTRTLLVLVRSAAGSVLEVAADGSKPFLTIGAAITATAAAGDVILVYPGTYSGNGNFNLSLGGKQVLLVSTAGAASTVVDLTSSGGTFLNLSNSGETRDTAIVGLTCRKCGAGAINMLGTTATVSATIYECSFDSNTNTVDGGAMRLEGSKVKPLLLDCVFVQNTRTVGSAKGAAIFSLSAQPTIEGCLFDRNTFTSSGTGCGIHFQDSFCLVNRSIFVGNDSGTGIGAAIGFTNSLQAGLTLTACIFDSNKNNSGGGSSIFGSAVGTGSPTDGNITVRDCTFLRGTTNAIHFFGTRTDPTRGILKIERSTFNANAGGAIFVQDACCVRISDSIFVANTGTYAVDLSGYGTTTLTAIDDTTFIANTGAAVDLNGSNAALPARVARCIFRGNTTTGNGGAVTVFGNGFASFTDCLFEGNRAVDGGALLVSGLATLDGCVIRGNIATSDGGGIYVTFGLGSRGLRLDRTLIAENTASARGGGLHLESAVATSPVTVSTTTIVENAAGNLGGGGVHLNGGTIGIVNSIIWNNTDTAVGTTRGAQIYVNGTGVAATIRSCDVHSGVGQIRDPGNLIDGGGSGSFVPGSGGNIDADPLFTVGPLDEYYLAQLAGEGGPSPCVDSGAGTSASAGVSARTTRSDHGVDTGTADMGYHRKP